MRLMYFPVNAAWGFIFGKSYKTAKLTSMGDQMLFDTRKLAVDEARRLGLKVNRSGIVSVAKPSVGVKAWGHLLPKNDNPPRKATYTLYYKETTGPSGSVLLGQDLEYARTRFDMSIQAHPENYAAVYAEKGPSKVKILCHDPMGWWTPQHLRENPLNRREAEDITTYMGVSNELAQLARIQGHEGALGFHAGTVGGMARTLRIAGSSKKQKRLGEKAGDWADEINSRHLVPKLRKKKRRNPPATLTKGAKLIGRQLIVVKTSQGTVKPKGKASVWGLPNGSIFLKGFFTNPPRGTVRTVDYFDEAKAKREGAKNPGLPWRHDFTKERRPLRKTRGGLLIEAGTKPLWGFR